MNTAALNGARGTAVDFGFNERVTQDGWNAASGRYKVKLDGEDGEKGKGKLVKVKVVNVEGEDGARFGPEGIGPPGREGIIGERRSGSGSGQSELPVPPPSTLHPPPSTPTLVLAHGPNSPRSHDTHTDPQQAPGREPHQRYGQRVYNNVDAGRPMYDPSPAAPGGNPKYKWSGH